MVLQADLLPSIILRGPCKVPISDTLQGRTYAWIIVSQPKGLCVRATPTIEANTTSAIT